MTDEAALLAAILDRPRDDTPRLVYADWLDDHGDPELLAEELRTLAHQLAKQGGRPSMAAEMTKGKKGKSDGR